VIDGQQVKHAGVALHTLTESPSHAGLPAISVPCGFTNLNLPVGLQIIGSRFADAEVLAVAARYQRATDWHTRHPVL
jgi:Asp-tRNA(Asn)/Glu-tRNA(Gln) amidotransferase A subunit family amidase